MSVDLFSDTDAAVAALSRRVDRIVPAFQRIADEQTGVADLDRRVNRLAASVHQVQRLQQRQEFAERDPSDPRLKRRLPQICKTLDAPGWGADFLRKATAARKAGPDALRRFCEAEREAGRLEF